MTIKSSRLHSPGQSYRGFKLIKVVEIPEVQCVLSELVHESTGAHVMHIGNQDPENFFCLSFQTFPYNSNGVAHILEHTVLCGSEKFPTKDPFFAMSRRSLNTFMNALTGADFTCYPAASQVPKDFYNLLDVYLDAVFHPNLNELSFLQEGHRLEFANPQDPSSPLEYKGIVYNEMKGSLSSPNSRLADVVDQTLFPDIPYGFNSGGDPADIPNLSYEELKQFYRKFYHPSRCLFFFYGSLPLEGHLDFIAEHTLEQATRESSLPPIPRQPRFKEPKYREAFYPIAHDEDLTDKTIVTFAWLTCHILEQEEALALSVLEIILMDTDASPLKRALLDSGLCKQASSFIDLEVSEVPWLITVRGCPPDQIDALEKLLLSTLDQISQKGIPLEMMENAIHQLELHRSEITGDHAPFGLSLFMRSALLKQHGANPEEGLMIHALFDKLRRHILADPDYLSQLIQQHLIINPHRVRVVMRPDPDLAAKESEEEKAKLEAIKASLTPEQTQQIIAKAAELASFQQKQEEEDIDVLPKVSLDDVSPAAKDYSLVREGVGQLDVFHHATFTNDIIYADLSFDLPDLPESDLPYLRLLTIVLTQMGAGDRDYVENLEYMQAHTGGLHAGISLNLQALDYNQFCPTFHIRGKALHRKMSKLFPFMHDTVKRPRLENYQRFKEILLKHFTGLESRLNQSALKYAINLSASSLNVASKVANDLYGLEYYWKMRDIVRHFDTQGPYVLAKLQELQERIMGLERPHLVLTCDAKTYDELKRHGFYGLQDIETIPFTPWKGDYPLESIESQGRLIASPVAFTGQVFKTIPYVDLDTPALSIAAFLFDNLVLHPKIREQGGAYGGGAVSNSLSGNFYFYAYRDPNIVSTLQAFKEAVNTVVRGDFDDIDLEEAKLEMIQSLDAPISPGSRAELAYGWWREGRTLEMRQAFRNRLLSLTKDDVIQAVKRVIVPNMQTGATVAFAGKELLEKENTLLAANGLTPLKIESV